MRPENPGWLIAAAVEQEIAGIRAGVRARRQQRPQAVLPARFTKLKEQLKQVAEVVVYGLFEQRLSDTLSDTAMDLAIDDHRVDDVPTIVGRPIVQEVDIAGLGIHLHKCKV